MINCMLASGASSMFFEISVLGTKNILENVQLEKGQTKDSHSLVEKVYHYDYKMIAL